MPISARGRRFLPVLLLLFEALLFNRWLILNPVNVIPWDIRFWHLPHAVFIADALRDGELPLWNPYIYCGMPFAANPQVALFYPLRTAAILVGTLLGDDRMLYCLEADVILSMFLAGAFAYYLARSLNLEAIPALFAATTYELGAFFASQAQHLGSIEVAAWLPLVWLGIVRLPSWRGMWLSSAALAMAILGGFTPLTIVVVMSGFILAFTARRKILPYCASLAVACLLSAVIVFPAAQLRSFSVSRFRTDWMGTGGGRPLASLWTLVYPNAFHILEPDRFSGKGDITFMYSYCGVVGIALAIFALFRRKSLAKPMVIIAAVLMLGDSTAFGRLFFSALPGPLKDPYYPQVWLAPFTLSLALLAAAGVPKGHVAFAALVISIADLTLCSSARPMNMTNLTREPAIYENQL